MKPRTRILLDLPCGHRVDLAGHGDPPDTQSFWFRMTDVYLTEEEIDDAHRALTKWTTHEGSAVAETVTFMHGGDHTDPLLHAVGRYRGSAEVDGWTMYLDSDEVAS